MQSSSLVIVVFYFETSLFYTTRILPSFIQFDTEVQKVV